MPPKSDQPVKKQTGSNLLASRGPGRPKGVPNRATTEFRDTVRALLEDNSANVGKWLAEVAQGKPAQLDEHGQILRKEVPAAPEKALDLLAKLAEYAAPKLNRTEHVGADGGAIQTVSRIELVPLAPGDKT